MQRLPASWTLAVQSTSRTPACKALKNLGPGWRFSGFGGFPEKKRALWWGGPKIKGYSNLGYILGPCVLGNYHLWATESKSREHDGLAAEL